MTNNGQIRDVKLQYDVNWKAAEISAISSGKIDKYEYLTSKEILPSNQQQIIEQTKFTYSPLEKAFEKRKKKNNWRSVAKTSWGFERFETRGTNQINWE